MSIMLAGLVGAIVVFVVLFKPGRLLVLRHIVGFLLAAAITGILVTWTFDTLYPYGSGSRTRMFNTYVAAGLIAAVVGPIVGMLAAWFWRRRQNA
jgi:MFS family permease